MGAGQREEVFSDKPLTCEEVSSCCKCSVSHCLYFIQDRLGRHSRGSGIHNSSEFLDSGSRYPRTVIRGFGRNDGFIIT